MAGYYFYKLLCGVIIMSKEIKAVKKVRNLMHDHWRQAIFCKEHNMKLDELKHREIEDVLRNLAMHLEDILETGYVNVKFEDD